MTLIVLLDVSAAFDTVDPFIFFILRPQSMLGLLGQLFNGFDPIRKIDRNKALNAVHNWMNNDKLILNNDKIEFVMIGTSKHLSKVSVSSIRAGDVDVITVHSAKNLGS